MVAPTLVRADGVGEEDQKAPEVRGGPGAAWAEAHREGVLLRGPLGNATHSNDGEVWGRGGINLFLLSTHTLIQALS